METKLTKIIFYSLSITLITQTSIFCMEKHPKTRGIRRKYTEIEITEPKLTPEKATQELRDWIKKIHPFTRPSVDQYKKLKILIEAGANVDIQTVQGFTILMRVAPRRPEMVQLLIDADAKLDLQHKNGLSALMYATINRNLESIQILIKEGADPSLRNKQGQTASTLASIYGFKDISDWIEEQSKLRKIA